MLIATIFAGLCLTVSFCSSSHLKRKRGESFSKAQTASKSRKTERQLNPTAGRSSKRGTDGSSKGSSRRKGLKESSSAVVTTSERPLSKGFKEEKVSKHDKSRSRRKNAEDRSEERSSRHSKGSLRRKSTSSKTITKSEESKQASQPALFKAYSFCRPLALTDDDPLVAKIKEAVQNSTASRDALEHVFSMSLQALQKQRSESMEHLKIAGNNIRLREMLDDWAALTSETVCSTNNVAAFQESTGKNILLAGSDCKWALLVIKEVYYNIFSMCLNADKEFLSADQVVAYLDVLLKAIKGKD